jgi:hypothetical protein
MWSDVRSKVRSALLSNAVGECLADVSPGSGIELSSAWPV